MIGIIIIILPLAAFVTSILMMPIEATVQTNSSDRYAVTKHTNNCHTEDIIIVDFDYLPPDISIEEAGEMPWETFIEARGEWLKSGEAAWAKILRINPTGTLVESIKLDFRVPHARLSPSGNYLTVLGYEAIMELDKAGNVINRIFVEGISHQVVVLDNGNYLVPCCYANSFAEVRSNGSKVFEWKVADHFQHYSRDNYLGYDIISCYPLELFNLYAQPNNREWTHINFVQKLPNGNYIASLRNLDLVIEIDGKSGEIVWSWGAGIVKKQHSPVVYGKWMYVFDNGNGRVVKVDRDTGRVVWEFDGLLAPELGDVRKLQNDNLLITDSLHQRIIEVNEETREIVWEMQTAFIPYRAWAVGSW